MIADRQGYVDRGALGFAVLASVWVMLSVIGTDLSFQWALRHHVFHTSWLYFVCLIPAGAIVTIGPIFAVDKERREWLSMLRLPRSFSLSGTVVLLFSFAFLAFRYRAYAAHSLHNITAELAIVSLALVVLEEMTFRAMLLVILLRALPEAPAVVLAGALFALVHVPAKLIAAQMPSHAFWTYLAVVTVLGIVWSFAALRFRSIWPSVLAHWANNLIL